MNRLPIFVLFIMLVACKTKQTTNPENQLENLVGKWTFEDPPIEYYFWNKQDSSYIGAKYSIIEGKDSLIELHSIYKNNGVFNYEISRIDSDFPTSINFVQVVNEQNQLKFERKEDSYPKSVLLEVHNKELTITQQGLMGNEEISLPLTYTKQN